MSCSVDGDVPEKCVLLAIEDGTLVGDSRYGLSGLASTAPFRGRQGGSRLPARGEVWSTGSHSNPIPLGRVGTENSTTDS